MKPILVTSYVNPDLDGVASAIAYGEFLQKTGTNIVVGFIGELQDEVKYIFDRFGFEYPRMMPNADDFDKIVLVDASDLNDLEGKIAAEKVVEIIDHREANGVDAFPNAIARVELVGAAATLVAEKFMQDATALSKESAVLLYGGIISNTLNFKGSMTTERDRQAAGWLNTIARLSGDFWREMFLAKSDMAGEKLARRIEDDFSWFVLGGRKIGIAELELMGAEKMIDERKEEIIRALERIQKELSLDIVFQNTIELEGVASFLVASNIQTQELLAKVFNTTFVGIVAKLPYPLMRKQLVPLLKKALE